MVESSTKESKESPDQPKNTEEQKSQEEFLSEIQRLKEEVRTTLAEVPCIVWALSRIS